MIRSALANCFSTYPESTLNVSCERLLLHMFKPPSLLRNDVSGSNHWMKVLPIGTISNRSAVGAQVVAVHGDKRQAKAVMAQSSYLSTNDRRLHFGLGAEKTANLEIRWPSGAEEKFADVAADQPVAIQEGKGVVRTEQFGRRK